MGIPRWWSASGTAKNFKKENERYKETDTEGFAQKKFDSLNVEAPDNFAGLDDRPPIGRSYGAQYSGGQSFGLGGTATRDPGSPMQHDWSKVASCLSTSDCASGYACVGGGCVFMSANVNSGSWNSPGGGYGGPCPPPPGNNPCNTGGPGACQSGPTCGDPPGGSPVDCCGGGINITLADGTVRPVCGITSWRDIECDTFCDSIFKNFGVYGLGCSEDADNQICPPCEECDFFTDKCEPITFGDVPCYCKENPCGDCYKCETDENSAAYGECIKSLDFCNFCVELPCQCQCSETTVFGCGPTEADARAAAARQCASICEDRDSKDEDCDGPCGDDGRLEMKLIARWNYFLGGEESSRHSVCTNGPAPTYNLPYSIFQDPCGNRRTPVHVPPAEGNFQYYVPQDPYMACIDCSDIAIGTGCPGR